jgi:hypothetical protein
MTAETFFSLSDHDLTSEPRQFGPEALFLEICFIVARRLRLGDGQLESNEC